VEARPPALRAENRLTPHGSSARFSSTSPAKLTTAQNARFSVVPTCVGPPEGSRSNTPPQARSQGGSKEDNVALEVRAGTLRLQRAPEGPRLTQGKP
jgi:hypothetical protein